MEQEHLLKVRLGPLRLGSPLMTASGTSGSADEIRRLADSGEILAALGAFVTKGVTLRPRPGNPGLRAVETASGLLNSIGLQNKGAERFLREDLPALAGYGLPVIVNISAGDAGEFRDLAAMLLEGDNGGIAGLEINVSCPNIKEGGAAFGASQKAVEKIVSAVRSAIPGKRDALLVTKLTPNVADIAEPARAAVAGGTHALSMINTLKGAAMDIRTLRPRFQNVVAGLSGPAIRPVGVYMVYECFKKIPECAARKVPIIGIGGIASWRDAAEYLIAGATAVGIGTAWFVRPDVFVQIRLGLLEYLAEKGISARELIGSAHRLVRAAKRTPTR